MSWNYPTERLQLGAYAPLALVIMMLGANLKPRICGTADGAATGMRWLVEIIRSFPFGNSGPAPDLLLIAPPRFTNRKLNDEGPAGNRSIAESELLPSLYHQIARDCAGAFFDAGTIATASPIDGVRLDAMNTRAIGEALVPITLESISWIGLRLLCMGTVARNQHQLDVFQGKLRDSMVRSGFKCAERAVCRISI